MPGLSRPALDRGQNPLDLGQASPHLSRTARHIQPPRRPDHLHIDQGQAGGDLFRLIGGECHIKRRNHFHGSADVTAPRRHQCATVGLRGSPKASGHVGDYQGRARAGEECIVLRNPPAPVRYRSRSPAPHTCRRAAGDGSEEWWFFEPVRSWIAPAFRMT